MKTKFGVNIDYGKKLFKTFLFYVFFYKVVMKNTSV